MGNIRIIPDAHSVTVWGQKLEPVADGVMAMEPAPTRNLGGISPHNRKPGGAQRCSRRVHIDHERRMRLSRGAEVLLHPGMQLAVWTSNPWHAEPASTARRQQRGLRQLDPAQNTPVELSKPILAARRTSHLHVMKHPVTLWHTVTMPRRTNFPKGYSLLQHLAPCLSSGRLPPRALNCEASQFMSIPDDGARKCPRQWTWRCPQARSLPCSVVRGSWEDHTCKPSGEQADQGTRTGHSRKGRVPSLVLRLG